ncbi:MAG: prolyl oligopeptidase family serine peptidase [Deltaproteobacteria bacterium]|nr:prolyl oligopeptidase family serine peptidase [Deltaproteobacteria bacterium]
MKTISRRAFNSLSLPFSAALFAACNHQKSGAAIEPPAEPGKQLLRTLPGSYAHWLYLPPEYDGNAAVPLLVFLHGSGERGTQPEAVKKHGPPRLIANGQHLPFIVASPQCDTGDWWSECRVIALFDHLSATLKVDPKRVYLTGLSMGGYGTWEVAARNPDRFAAIVPICGGGDSRFGSKPLSTIPTWAFHGEADAVVPVAESLEMIEAMKGHGAKEAKLTIYPAVEHDSWTQTYDNPEVYSWLLSHRRSAG